MNFEMEVSNILETKVYKLSEEEKTPMIKNWLDQKDLLQNTQEEKCRTAKGLFTVLCSKFSPDIIIL